MNRFVTVVPGKPQGHQSNIGDGKNVSNLHGLHCEFRRRQERERYPVGRAVKVVVPILSDPANPEEHRAGRIESFPDGDFAVAWRTRDDGFRGPRFPAIGRGSGKNRAGVFVDGVLGATAVGADQLVADSLCHRPGVVAAHVLNHVRLRGGFHGRHLDHRETGGAGKGVAGKAGLPLNPHCQWSVGNDFVVGLQNNGPGMKRFRRKRCLHRFSQGVAIGERSSFDHL